MKKTRETIDTVTSNIIGVTGMTITHNIGSTLPGTTGAIAGTHIPTFMGLGLMKNTIKKQ